MKGGGVLAVKKTDIKKDILDELERNGIYGNHYLDLVNDYMSLWEIKNKLLRDIKVRGVNIRYQNGENQWGYKKNDSISELNKISAQMLKILSDLGVKTSNFVKDDDEDDEM